MKAKSTVFWRNAILNRRVLICVFIGFSLGMPLYVLFQRVPAWLREGGVSLTDIGLFALVGIPYTWKIESGMRVKCHP